MDGGSKHYTGGGDQNHAKEKETQEGKWLPAKAFKVAEKRRLIPRGSQFFSVNDTEINTMHVNRLSHK